MNNLYTKLEEFYEQYAYPRDYQNEHYTGIEFLYHGVEYRISRDYNENNGKEEYFTFYFKDIENPTPEDIFFGFRDQIIIDIFKDLNDALDNWIIDGKPLKEIIISEETEILSQD